MKHFFKLITSLVLLSHFYVALGNICGSSCCSGGSCPPPSECSTCDSSCGASCCLDPCDGYPFLAYRSQSVNAAREIVGWQEFLNQYCMDEFYGSFYVAFEYTRSFRPSQITRFFFGRDLVGCDTLLLQGSAIQNRHPSAWCADYFGLPIDFQSKVSFCPHIENYIVDLNFYLGLDEIAEGVFFKIHTPIVHTRWNLGMCEKVMAPGAMDFPPLYMAEDAVPRDELPCSLTEVMNGCITFGDMKESIQFGRISNCEHRLTRLADIHASFGWNFVLDQDYHFGFFIHAAAPTGNRPKACYLFEPMIGNGKHWELGGGITGSAVFWRDNCCEDKYLGVYFDATITHMFDACQRRSFDFCGAPNSRYGLLAQMGRNMDQLKGDDPKAPNNSLKRELANFQYNGNLIPAINYTTFNVDVKVDLQADFVIKFAYACKNWSADLGYNLWVRSGEKFSCDDLCNCCPCPCPADNIFTNKGDSFLYGCQDPSCNMSIPLSSSQKNANIHYGENMILRYKGGKDADDAALNKGVDNPKKARAGIVPLLNTEGNQLYTSIQPVLACRSNLNFCKSPSALTHKLFAHFNYAWNDTEHDWTPYIGLGGEIELSTCNADCCCSPCNAPTCNSCTSICLNPFAGYCGPCNGSCDGCCEPCSSSCKKRGGVSQWGVWLKGGFYFEATRCR